MLKAPLTKWALNKEVSIHALPRISLSQLARRCEVTGLWGLMNDRKKRWGSSGSICLCSSVIISYRRRHLITHRRLSLGKAPNVNCFGGAPAFLFLPKVGNWKQTPSGL